MYITIKDVDFRLAYSDLKRIREAVFVKEQGVPLEMEWDEHDNTAHHILAIDDQGQVLGTARLLPDGRIGRMAVLVEWRKQGIGSALLQHLLNKARLLHFDSITLSAQVSAIPFYEKMGFTRVGKLYTEAGIPHQQMMLDLLASQKR